MPDDEAIPLAHQAVISYAALHHSNMRRASQQSTFLTAAFVWLWLVAAVLALGAVAGLVWLVSSPAFAAVSPLLGVLLLVALGVFMRGLRRARAVAALNYLEQAVRLNLPLPPMIRAAEQGETGRMRKKLQRLRERLEEGLAVADALELSLPGLPARTLGLIDAAERNGRLASMLARLVQEHRRPQRSDPTRAIFMRWYPVMLIVGLTAGLGFFAVFVMPKFEQIFRDFGIALPRVTVVMVRLWLYISAPLGAVVALLTLLSLGRMVTETVFPAFARGNFGAAGQLPQWLAWWLPVARQVVRNRGLADVFVVMSDATAAGRPIHAALSDAARLGINVVLRGRLERWAEGVEKGMPLGEAAREAGMPRLVCGMLATTSARGAADAADVFAFLARYYDSRFSRAAALVEGATIPAMVLVFAFFVGTATVGLFLPLVNLMDRVGQLSGFN